MGMLASAEAVVFAAAARAMLPPPPPDITAWCEANIVFDDRSPMPGPFRIERFMFLREIHEVLSPEHPAREVTVRGSAQFGKTVSIIQPTLGAWHAYTALDSLVVHPTQTAAKEWVMNKWLPMRRSTPALREIFGEGRGDNVDAMFNMETVERNGSLKVASAGSPADLTGTSRRLVIGDDISKWEMSEKGDPEALMVSRAQAFEEAKILRTSTAMIKGTCRISRAYDRSDQRLYHVPCPHCGNMAPLTWENFRANIDPERLHAAHFTCDACGCVIGHGDKEAMVRQGRWVAQNPKGDHPGFHLWGAYAPQRDWASIAVAYAQVMGWTSANLTEATAEGLKKQVEAETEQVFWNDVLGLPYEQASKGPDWEALRDRAETAPEAETLPQGILPATGFILAAGADCQADRIEVQIVAFGRNLQRRVIGYKVIPYYVGDKEGRDALDALMKETWRTERGLKFPLDMLAIDSGAFTEDVKAWAKKYPASRVIHVKGAVSASGPVLLPMRERRADGKVIRTSRQGFMLNVSQMKADFYAWLAKVDPLERGFVGFARAMGDEYYRQLTAEVRVLSRSRSGVVTSSWALAEAGRRNEALDTMNYAEAAARRRGWTALTDDQWNALADERGAAPPEGQGDLFDASLPVVDKARPEQVPRETDKADNQPARTPPDRGFLGLQPGKKWF
jgi:phage terminase large subunit GpA-like protein